MITANAFQIQDRATRRFIQHEIVDGVSTPCRWGWVWHDDPCRGGAWRGEHIDRWLAESGADRWLSADVEDLDLVKVPAPACGCCGAIERDIVDGRYQITLARHRSRGRAYWRCQKHVGRSPCVIEGCRRTYANDEDGYHVSIVCGRHWKQAPRYMRDAVARVRRLATRRGWDDQLSNRHHRLWWRCIRAIREGQNLDMAEIEKMFGI